MKYIGTENLVWQADTRVSTFPSGLVLVQRRAIVRKTRAEILRRSLEVGDRMPIDNDPSIDGVFIFPAVQEQSSPGFVEFLVSGYGRTTNTGQTELIPTVVSVDTENANGTLRTMTTLGFRSIVRRVTNAGAKPDVSFPANISTTVTVIESETPTPGSGKSIYERPAAISMASYERTNYGKFDEETIVWESKYVPKEFGLSSGTVLYTSGGGWP